VGSNRALAFSVFLALAATPGYGDDSNHSGSATGQSARFEQFKRLAGEWIGKEAGKEGHDIHVSYKVTAGGSAVVETIAAGTEHEMVTVIHPDGDDLILTHYCMLGNQPQMRATGKGDSGKVEFKFVKATNLKSEKDMYMHNATFHFVDKDTLKTEWTHFMDGKDAGRAVFELKRKS
jgi:hypothetical protein